MPGPRYVDRRSTIIDVSPSPAVEVIPRARLRAAPAGHTACTRVGAVKRVTVIVVGCGLTWAAAAVGIGLAVRLHDRLREANVASAEVAPPDTAPASEQPVAEPAAESPADEDEGRAAAPSRPARVLRLHPPE